MIKKIFKKQIAVELLVRKHELVYTEPNLKKPWLTVFCFRETVNLLSDLTQITDK